MNKCLKSINKVKRMLIACKKRYLLKFIIKITTNYHSTQSEERQHKSGWMSTDHNTACFIFFIDI
jgi:hypothetical protein